MAAVTTVLTEEQKDRNTRIVNLDNKLAELRCMTLGQLAAYAENEHSTVLNMDNGVTWMRRKVGYLEQARIMGGLTGRAAERAAELDTPAKIAELKAEDAHIESLSTIKQKPQTGGNKMSDEQKKPAEKAPRKEKATKTEKAAGKKTGTEKAAGKKTGTEKAAAPAKKGRAGKYAPTDKITLLTKENPKRPGTSAHDRFALYSKCKTVGAFLENGGTSADLNFDAKHGFIKIAA